MERIVVTRSTLPIIGNILFETTKDGLKLSANNLEMGIEIILAANIKSEGAILVPAKTLGGVVSKLPEGEVNFKLTEKGTARLTYQQSHSNLHTLPADEFPTLPKIKEGKTLTLNSIVFAEMIKQTIFATSSSEDKYVLTGVLFEIEKKEIRLVATDGYRLAKRVEKVELEKVEGGSCIVPAKVLLELQRILQAEEGDLKITLSGEQISFKYKEIYLVSRLIQGQFPDYHQVIPKESRAKFVAPTQALLEASERTAVIAGGAANIVRFELKGGKLYLSTNSPDVGSIEEILEVEAKGGEKANIAFNIRLIIDALKAMDAEKVILEFSEPLSPGVIRPSSGIDYLYIAMPIRAQEAV